MPRKPKVPCPSGCVCGKAQCAMYELCHCGCGFRAPVARKTVSARGCFEGKPQKFIRGHAGILPRSEDSSEVFWKGIPCRKIPLTKGQYALVRSDRYEGLKGYRWQAKWVKNISNYYAVRRDTRNGDKVVYMHRQIMGLPENDVRQVDHVDPMQTLVNVDGIGGNLRISDFSQQATNKRKRSDNTSGYKGVDWDKRKNLWRAQICARGKHYFLGYRRTPELAYELYCQAAVALHGEFARLD